MATLLEDIQAFCGANRVTLADFGELAMNDRGFTTRLKNGRDIKMSTDAKVRKFMAEYQPAPSEFAPAIPKQAAA